MNTSVVTAADAPTARSGRTEGSQDPLPFLLPAGIAVLTAAPVIRGKLEALAFVCVLAAPFVARRFRRDRLIRLLAASLLLWCLGQLLSDERHSLGTRLSMQLVTAVTVLCTTAVLVLLGRRDFGRIRVLVAGVAAGLCLESILVEHGSLAATTTWKFGLNTPVAVGLLALTDLAWRRGQKIPSVVALGAICLLGVATDHRHLAGVSVLTAIVLLLRNGQRHPKTVSVLAGMTLLVGALSGAFIQASESGVLGERSGGQIAQFGHTPQAIFVNVRPEPFQEFYLFTLHPVLGWGSQPRLDSSAYAGSKEFLQHLGVVREDLDNIWLKLEVPGVSAHSQAMDSLARAGVTAAPFWLLLVGLALVVGIRAIRFRSSPLVVLWTILVIWDAICSPLTALSHIELSAYLALAITSLRSLPPPGARGD